MDSILRIPDQITVLDVRGHQLDSCDVTFEKKDGSMAVSLSGLGELAQLKLCWNMETKTPVRVLCDAWERTYGQQEWASIRAEKPLPWFFFVLDETQQTLDAYGVKVRPHAFIHFYYTTKSITMVADVRSGSLGLSLNGRVLPVCDIVYKQYPASPLYTACEDFCSIMSPHPLLPKEPVYGGNNWYYAYGKSSFEQICSDTKLQARLARGLSNRPFMTIDDGWEQNTCCGPWTANPDYRDMGALAQAIRDQDVRPGLWIRYLNNSDTRFTKEMRMANGMLDPTNPFIIEHIRELNHTIVHDWGYELIKHDFSTVDITTNWGPQMNGDIMRGHDVQYYDKSLTTAEVVLQFYHNILDSVDNKAYILGCNTVGHLCAGLVHLNRTGDDTSGRDFNVTRFTGVNTLAFRLFQNRHFYMNDADCVGIMGGQRIDWRLNYQWAELVARSGSPLFISCADGTLNAEQEEQMRALYAIASKQSDQTYPLDWLWNTTPDTWSINGEIRQFNWYLY